jgi:imidazolonepropionase-like amidohydrolase
MSVLIKTTRKSSKRRKTSESNFTMQNHQRISLISSLIISLGASLLAQNVTITNARIIGPNGNVIERGSIAVRDGKIASVSAGAPSAKSGQVINASGMTAMPGFIDAHKHVNTGPSEKAYMQSILEAGYTTVLSAGGPGDGTLALRDHIESGMINGPRVIPSERINLRGTPDEARAAIRAMAAKGIKQTAEIALGIPQPDPTPHELEVLKAAVEEAAKVGVQVNVHSVTTASTLMGLGAGVRRFVHLPERDYTSHEAAERIVAAGAIVAGLNAFGSPIIDRFSGPNAAVQFPKDDTPRARDGKPWPEAIPAHIVDPNGKALGAEAGYTIVNARTFWDASHSAVGFSTDQNYADLVVLEHELKSFSIMFSMQDIFQIMGPNTAAYVGMGDQIGTLEPGKLADIILLSGNPLENIYAMLTTRVVIKGGKIVVDKRSKR